MDSTLKVGTIERVRPNINFIKRDEFEEQVKEILVNH